MAAVPFGINFSGWAESAVPMGAADRRSVTRKQSVEDFSASVMEFLVALAGFSA